jgi:hypothetical protein
MISNLPRTVFDPFSQSFFSQRTNTSQKFPANTTSTEEEEEDVLPVAASAPSKLVTVPSVRLTCRSVLSVEGVCCAAEVPSVNAVCAGVIGVVQSSVSVISRQVHIVHAVEDGEVPAKVRRFDAFTRPVVWAGLGELGRFDAFTSCIGLLSFSFLLLIFFCFVLWSFWISVPSCGVGWNGTFLLDCSSLFQIVFLPFRPSRQLGHSGNVQRLCHPN